MRGGRRGNLPDVIPAQAGIHLSADRAVHKWVPAFAGMTIFNCRALCASSAASALKRFLFFLLIVTFAAPAWAGCIGVVADDGTRCGVLRPLRRGRSGAVFSGCHAF